MSTSDVELMQKLGISDKSWLVRKIINDYQNVEHMFAVILHPIRDFELPVHYLCKLFWVVRREEAFLFCCIYALVFFNVLFDRVPNVVDVD